MHIFCWRNLLFVGGTTIPVALLTEEGFFRGWLWASLRRANQGRITILAADEHRVRVVALVVGRAAHRIQPANRSSSLSLCSNAAVLGAIWGMLRLLSGSLVVASVSHGVWNGLAYTCSLVLDRTLARSGSLNTTIYGPEIGVLGLLLNLGFAAALYCWCVREDAFAPANA